MRPWQPPETTGATVMAARSRRHEGMPPYAHSVRRTALHTEPGGPMWASAPTKGTIEPRRKPVRAGIKPAPTRRPEKPPLGDQGEVAGRRPDGGDQNRQKLEQTIPQSRCASQLPLHKGACPLRRRGWQRSAKVHPPRQCGRLIAAPTGAVELAACWQPPETTGATVMAACRPPETVEKPQKTCEAAHRGKGGQKAPFTFNQYENLTFYQFKFWHSVAK